jgi:hypothetical protein
MALETGIFIGLFLLGIGAIMLAVIIYNFTRQLLVNTVVGFAALLLINFLADLIGLPALKIAISFASVAVTAVLGLAGVGLLILLNLVGIHV